MSEYSEERVILLDEDSSGVFEVPEFLNSSEKRLLFAICERAVRDLFSSNEEERAASIAWFEDDEGNEPFSFPWICEVLDLNRMHLLSKIRSLHEIGANSPNASREIYALIGMNNEEPRSAA